jgi:hypothetical protein
MGSKYFDSLKMVLILEHPKRKAKSDIRTKKFYLCLLMCFGV